MVAAKLIFGRTWQEYLGHKTSLTLFVEVPVPNQESARSCVYMCVRDIDFDSFYDFGYYVANVQTVWYFLFSILLFRQSNDGFLL
jgi:hypothetical protein